MQAELNGYMTLSVSTEYQCLSREMTQLPWPIRPVNYSPEGTSTSQQQQQQQQTEAVW